MKQSCNRFNLDTLHDCIYYYYRNEYVVDTIFTWERSRFTWHGWATSCTRQGLLVSEQNGNRSGKFPDSCRKDRVHQRDCVYIEGLSVVDVEEGKEALGKLLSGVMGSGSCVASCPPSVIPHLSPANTRTISQLSTRASLTTLLSAPYFPSPLPSPFVHFSQKRVAFLPY